MMPKTPYSVKVIGWADLWNRITTAVSSGQGPETVWEEALGIGVPENASLPVARWAADSASGSPDRYLSVTSGHDRFPSNRHFFSAIKDLERDAIEPDEEITQVGEPELRVHLEAPAYAYFVYLEVPDEATRFSVNYFDLQAGETRTITVTNKNGTLTENDLRVRSR